MKIALYILLGIAVAWGIFAFVNYLRQRRAQQRAEREGLVLYGNVISAERAGGLLKHLDIYKIRLSIQEPDRPPREVTLSSRLAAGQRLDNTQRIMVIVDPVDAERVYPASAEAAKRVIFTGSRTERKLMQAQMKNPRRFPRRPPSGYQPPINKIR